MCQALFLMLKIQQCAKEPASLLSKSLHAIWQPVPQINVCKQKQKQTNKNLKDSHSMEKLFAKYEE